MNNQKRTPYLLILSLLVAGCLSISPAANAGDTLSGNSVEVSQLLTQIKTEAKALEHDADELAVWTRGKNLHWQTHSAKISEIKDHVNEAGQLLDKLNQAREGGASAWQHQAIDRIYPLLKELADNTEATINHLNDDRNSIRFGEYEDHTRASYNVAKDLAALISDYVDFSEHEAEYHRLQDKLQPSTS